MQDARAKWMTVLAGVIGCAAGSGVVSSYAFGLFIKSIAQEFGWSRVDTTLSITMFYFGAGFGTIALGAAMTRWGVRAPSIIFVILFGLSLATVAVAPGTPIVFAALFTIMGIFAAASTLMPYAIALTGWFDRRRGLVMAIANAGTSAGGIFMSYYAFWLLKTFGWRGGYVGIGIFVAAVPLLGLIFLLRVRPAPVAQGGTSTTPRAPTPSLFASGPFWQIGIPLFAISVTLLGAITSLAPMLTDRGLAPAKAASILALVGGASFISRFGIGLFLDTVHVRYVAATLFGIVLLGIVLLIFSDTGPAIWMAAICLGLGVGAEAEYVSYSASRYFSADVLSRSLGTIWIFFAWGAGLGVLVGSVSYDLSGSYMNALYIFAILALAALAIVLTLGEYRYGLTPERDHPFPVEQPV